MRVRLGALALIVTLAACGGETSAPAATPPPSDPCDVAGTGVNVDVSIEPCAKLSSYRIFKGPLLAHEPNDGVVAYDLNTPLFSDYAEKRRFIYVPAGKSAKYDDEKAFDFPVGTVITKTFAFPKDLRAPGKDLNVVETRLLMRRADGWVGLPYIWNAEQTEAELVKPGKDVAMSLTATDGTQQSFTYHVPNSNECKKCHQDLDGMAPIGPKARSMNRDHAYGGKTVNQLDHLAALGMLSGAPASADAPKLAVWNDPDTGTLEQRARAYLDVNCSHCHSPRGPARTSGLFLSSLVTNPSEYGVCKPPVAAAQGTGGFQYSIVPGNPDTSIMVFRLSSTEAGKMMPELGRALVHNEGVNLVREWIASMPATDCTVP